MFHINDVTQLGAEEQIEAIVRKHTMTLVPRLLLAGLLIIVPFFFLFSLLRGGVFGILVFVILIAVGLFLALRTMHIWDADVLLVTNKRVIDVDQHGLWARVVAEVPLTHIQDVRWERAGFMETLFRMGTVRLLTSAATTQIVVPRIAHPERLQKLLQDLRHQPVAHAEERASEAQDKALSRREQIQLLLARASNKTLEEVQALLEARTDV